MVISNWPMWVVGLTLFVDGMDQYIVRGSSDQIKAAFGVGDTAIGLLFSAFILVNGIVTLPAGYLADRWNRTRAMAVTIVAWSVISALGGLVPTAAFGLLVVSGPRSASVRRSPIPRAAASSPTTTGPSAAGRPSPFSSA